MFVSSTHCTRIPWLGLQVVHRSLVAFGGRLRLRLGLDWWSERSWCYPDSFFEKVQKSVNVRNFFVIPGVMQPELVQMFRELGCHDGSEDWTNVILSRVLEAIYVVFECICESAELLVSILLERWSIHHGHRVEPVNDSLLVVPFF